MNYQLNFVHPKYLDKCTLYLFFYFLCLKPIKHLWSIKIILLQTLFAKKNADSDKSSFVQNGFPTCCILIRPYILTISQLVFKFRYYVLKQSNIVHEKCSTAKNWTGRKLMQCLVAFSNDQGSCVCLQCPVQAYCWAVNSFSVSWKFLCRTRQHSVHSVVAYDITTLLLNLKANLGYCWVCLDSLNPFMGCECGYRRTNPKLNCNNQQDDCACLKLMWLRHSQNYNRSWTSSQPNLRICEHCHNRTDRLWKLLQLNLLLWPSPQLNLLIS